METLNKITEYGKAFGVEIKVSPITVNDLLKDYKEEDVLTQAKIAIEWIAETNKAKDMVLRSSRLRKFMTNVSKKSPNKYW